MRSRPVVFISATSSDLGVARDLAAKLLISLGYDADWQDLNATEGGDLLEILKSKVRACDAVVQLVGRRYGFEPPQKTPPFGRVSYTQFEALYAESIGKKVIYVVLQDDFPSSPAPPEPAEAVQLQERYRSKLQSTGALFHPARSLLELENRILRCRDDLQSLRAAMERSRRRWVLFSSVALSLLAGIGLGVGGLYLALQRQEVRLGDIRESAGRQETSLTSIDTSVKQQTDDVRNIAGQIEEIRKMSPGSRLDRLTLSLASANAEDLELLTKAGLSPREIEAVLIRTAPGKEQTVAREFFESGRTVPAAMDWFRKALASGVNPNLLRPHAYYQQSALVNEALSSGNATAALHLLDAGASPHGYQNLFLTVYDVPAFLFPYTYLANNARFTLDEKRRLAEAFRDHGAALLRMVPGMPPEETSYRSEAIETILNDSETLFGIKLDETKPQVVDSPLAARAEAVTGVKWSEWTRGLPRYVVEDPDQRPQFHLFETRHFLGAFADQFYFLGVGLADFRKDYALIEVSKDQVQWHVYAFIGPRAAMGLAQDEKGNRRDRAWRRFDFTWDRAKQKMRLFNHYDFKIESTWP